MSDVSSRSHRGIVAGAISDDDVLRERAEALAAEQEVEPERDLVSLLWFRLGAERYAVRLDDVREVMQEYAVAPLPCVPDWILGVTNIRGEIVSVSDPARLMGVGSVAQIADALRPAVLVRSGERVTALVVDEVGSIIEVDRSGIEPPVSAVDRGRTDCLGGSVYVDGTVVGLLDTDRVLQPIAHEPAAVRRGDSDLGGRHR